MEISQAFDAISMFADRIGPLADRLERLIEAHSGDAEIAVSIDEAAKRLSVSPSTMYHLCNAGRIPTVHLTRGAAKPKLGVLVSDLHEYVRRNRHVPRGWE